MSAELLLSELQALNIRLSVEGDRLRCSAPKGRLTDDLGRRIAAHKSELIQALSTSGFKAFPIQRRSPGDTMVPLSFAQERFWFLQNLEPDTTAYNITAYRCVSTPVDTNALQFALRALIDKHETLRTTFPEVDGVPRQLVHQASCPELAVRDFGPLQGEARTTAFNAVVEEFATHTFDLQRGPLLRIALVRFSDHDQCFVVCLHHILCDAWSIGIFFAELESLYTAHISGQPANGTSLPIQYADFAIWERGRETSGELRAQIDYWKEKLQAAPSYLELPTDHTRPEFQLHERRRHGFQIDASTSQSWKSLASQEGATLFMGLLSIFKALLFHYTKQTDIVVGTPVSTRNYAELEQLIGCFINTHVLRTSFPSSATARDLLARVRATVLEALHHPDVPFERLVSELLTERDMSRAPIFQVAFILQNTPSSSEYDVISGGNDFDMTLYMWEANGLIHGNVEYNSTLFEPETIAGFARCFETLAAEMVAHPNAPIDRLPVVTAAQEAESFGHYNGPALPIPALCAHEWIEQQASATPDAIAVVAGEERLTYKQLDQASNRLAHRLREMGVARGSLVALCLDRTADLVIAPLAVWKAGGAYLPLDPEFPSERLAFMLEDSAATVLVTQSHLLTRLPSDLPPSICLDREPASLECDGTEPLGSPVSPDDLAYLLYTSGSTGKPKGVEIAHKALVNFLSSMQREPGIGPSDRLLAVTTFSFDIAGLELYLPLVTGAQVVIAPRATVVDGAALIEMLNHSGITVMQATPATWRLLLESGWKETPGLKILCGGEALTASLAKQLMAAGAEVWNLYGPTETTIWSTLERLSPSEQISIGRPIANTQIHLLDDYGHPAPVGVAAELYIGGDGLARGYLRREQLTAQRFVYSAFHGGKRLYRTGDLARRLPGGGLEYKGRIDDQVKLRGFRIEPGEIESALEKQSGISQAVVVVREDNAGDPQLIAYLKTADSVLLDSRTLRKQLLTFLPEYMIPSSFVQLEAFPLTANGKVNRKALRSPEYGPRQLSGASERGDQPESGIQGERFAAGYIPPSNNIELTMAEIWREVLGADRVGVLDNFFELGGHSLTAVRLVSRLKAAFDMDLPLRCLFLHPTISELARHISFDAATHSYRYTSELPKWSCLVPVQPRGSRPPLFMVAGYSDPDATLLALSQLAPHLGMDQPLFGLRPRWLQGNVDYASVEEMAREFVAEVRAAQPKGPYLLGGWCVGGIAALEIAQLLQEQGEEVKLMVLLDTERPSFSRTVRMKILNTRDRMAHIINVLSEIAHAGPQRSTMVRQLVHKKVQGNDPFYRSMIAYQRQLYSHTPKRYPGRITLILNEEEIRYRQKDLGWTDIPLLGLDVHVVSGDHYTIMKDYAKDVAQVILRSIEGPGAGHLSMKRERTAMQAVGTSFLSS